MTCVIRTRLGRGVRSIVIFGVLSRHVMDTTFGIEWLGLSREQ
jgi:hypothetical protein